MKLLKKLPIFILCFALISCGYFSDKPVDDAGTYRSEKLANSCELDVEELAKILEVDVEGQIDCLEENLINFTKYVKRENQEAVTGSELGSFVRRFFKGHASIIVDSMGLIFDINSLFLRDGKGSIATENIKPLFNLLRIANRRISNFMQTIKKFDEDELQMISAQMLIEKDLSEFSKEVKKIITENGNGADSSINLKDFFTRVSDRFDGVAFDENTLNGLFALKKLYLGGERDTLTRPQLFLLLDRLPQLGGVAFSMLYASDKNQGGFKNLYTLFKRNVEVFNDQIFPHRREEVIFRSGEVEGLIEAFFPDDKELYVEVAKKAKVMLLGARTGDGPYTYQELRNISFLTLSLLEGLIFIEGYRESTEDNKNLTKNNWNWKRDQFIKLFDDFREYLITSLNENIYFPEKMKLLEFADFLAEKFDSFPVNKKYLSIGPIGKVVIVGGEKDTFTKLEILNLLEKSNDLAEIFYDVIFSNSETHDEQAKRQLYYLTVKKLRLLITTQKYLHVSTIQELVNMLSDMLGKEGLKTYTPTVEIMKEKVLGGYSSSVTVSDISKSLEMAEDFLGKYYYLDLSYDAYKDQVEVPKKIYYLSYRHHKDFKHFSKDEILAYKKVFTELIMKFRLYTNSDGTQYYGDDYKRTKYGLLRNFMIKYFAEIVTEAFGSKLLEKDTHAVTMEQLNNVIFIFKPVLEDYGLWTKFPETFSRNVILLADLFQGQSDGNLAMDPIEAAEYGTLALFAINSADRIVDEINIDCKWITKKGVEGFDLDCYRTVFFDALLNKLNLKERLPKLNKYINSISEKEAMEFLVSVEGFARESKDQERPETKKDLVLLIGALLNIESTFLRYDLNKSNYIDPRELLGAFPIYEEAIMLVADLDESKRGYAKSIFLYMIKHMEKPTQWDVATFHYNPFRSSKIGSKRLNIGALLYNMVMTANEKASEEANQQ
ncbi:MAG: hypothetical protein NXH75_09430 [Halobacteriovoraceae bacterium]|nr:hypothetical protein [Halobacteriovoraceae bacterium]